MFVDVHCHLNSGAFDNDRDEVIKRAEKIGMIIIDSGTCMKDNRKSLNLSRKYRIVKSSFGLYPIHAVRLNENELSREIEFIEKSKNGIIAVGEIGMDGLESRDIDEQKKIFERMLALAEKIRKPVVVHSRKAERECIEIMESFKIRNVDMHCFTGNFRMVKRIQDNGWTFSIPTNITRLMHFQKIVKEASISQILTETDSPYLSPFKEERNEPSFVVEAVKKISEIKKLDEEETKKLIYMNFQRFFLKD